MHFKLKAMKTKVFSVFLLLVLACWTGLDAQSTERSSGVLKLEMKKQEEKTRANEYSQSTQIHMTRQKTEPAPVQAGSVEKSGVDWISPSTQAMKTAESRINIETAIEAGEYISFINLFVNGQFVKNIIPPTAL